MKNNKTYQVSITFKDGMEEYKHYETAEEAQKAATSIIDLMIHKPTGVEDIIGVSIEEEF